VDGTTNFVNGLPLYASAVAVLHAGRPVAGAIWCATSHALRPGVYHARSGGPARFDGVALRVDGGREVAGRRRRVSTAPLPVRPREASWDHRHIGSAALESAFVAAAVLASARMPHQRAWDVAAGVVLAEAAGREVWTETAGRWEPFVSFGAKPEDWRQSMLFGDSVAVTALRSSALAL
jgi:myo-inositol-1(or 4)-monophosphatase